MLLKWRQRHFVRFLPLTGNPFLVPVGLQQLLKQLSVRSETEILGTYNAAMDEVARNIPRKRQPLPSQLVSWEESSPAQRQFYIEKAVEDCMLVCNVIAPNDGKTLFHALSSPGGEKDETAEADDLLKSLMTTYKNAKTKSIKTQILMRISTRLAH